MTSKLEIVCKVVVTYHYCINYSDINQIGPDLGNFMSYDTKRMQSVREKILSISNRLSEIVGER
jgi:hypothetical protein